MPMPAAAKEVIPVADTSGRCTRGRKDARRLAIAGCPNAESSRGLPIALLIFRPAERTSRKHAALSYKAASNPE
jgi:hypothetical protein